MDRLALVFVSLSMLTALPGCRSEPLGVVDVDCSMHASIEGCLAAPGCELETCQGCNGVPTFGICFAKGAAHGLLCTPPVCIDANHPCSSFTDASACDDQPACHAVHSGELPCNGPSCLDHFVRCAEGPARCDGSVQQCADVAPCPMGGSCLPGQVYAYADALTCCPEGCVSANKCDATGGGE